MKVLRLSLCLFCFALLLCCCTRDGVRSAGEWLEAARACYAAGDYAGGIAAIDSLRSQWPEAVAERHEALQLYKTIELARAEREVALIDSTLQAVQSLYDQARAEAEAAIAAGTATAPQLDSVTRLKLRRDSLEGAFNFQCAKIKKIKNG